MGPSWYNDKGHLETPRRARIGRGWERRIGRGARQRPEKPPAVPSVPWRRRRHPQAGGRLRRLVEGARGLDPVPNRFGPVNSKGERRVTSPSQAPRRPRSVTSLAGGSPGRGGLLSRGLPGVNPLPFLLPLACLRQVATCARTTATASAPCGPLHSLRRLVGTSSAAARRAPAGAASGCGTCPRVCLCTSTVPGLAYGICAAQRDPAGHLDPGLQGVLLPRRRCRPGPWGTRSIWEVSRLATQDLATRQNLGPYRASLCSPEGSGDKISLVMQISGICSTCRKEVPIAAQPGSWPRLTGFWKMESP